MGIDRDRTHIFQSTFFQVGADPVRQAISGGDATFLVTHVEICLPFGEIPDLLAERAELCPYPLKALGVVSGCFNFSPGTDHPIRTHNVFIIRLAVAGHSVKIESIEATSENLPLLDHHIPIQDTLHDLHHQELKLLSVIINRHAPFLIVVADYLLIPNHQGQRSIFSSCQFDLHLCLQR